MKRLLIALACALGLALLAPFSASAASADATVYVVHGIPGKDISPAVDPALPVDVSVNGACALPGFTFGTITDGIGLPAGNYTIAISLANPAAPCSNAPVIGPVTVPLAAGQSYAIVAHLTAAGAPTASLFTLDTSKLRGGNARAIVHHTAAAPAVDIAISRGKRAVAALAGVTNGAQAVVELRPGSYRVTIAPAGTTTFVYDERGHLPAKSVNLVFAVGSVTNGTFELIFKRIK